MNIVLLLLLIICIQIRDISNCTAQLLSVKSRYSNFMFIIGESFYRVFQKSDAKIQITITTAYLIRINILLAALIVIFLS